MFDSLVANCALFRGHVFDHPGQMGDVVGVDDRIDEIASESIVATATRGRTDRTGMNIWFDYSNGPRRDCAVCIK